MPISIQTPLIALFVLSLCFLVSNNSYADAFKCTDKKGNIIFQDSECGDNKKETRIKIKKYAVSSSCLSVCDSARAICLADLGFGKRNTSRGMLLCEQAKQACDVSCNNPARSRELEAFTAIERSFYEREIRDKQYQRDEENYLAERERRAAQREEKVRQRRCQWYKRKLAKEQARWRRVQGQGRGWTPSEEEHYRLRLENASDAVVIECQ